MAIEDRRFYRHEGFDFYGLARAAYYLLLTGRVRGGGSTITQQLAKNAFLTNERSVSRKVREAFLAAKLDSYFTKDEILGFYLNRVYYGNGAIGIDSAARRYFGTTAYKLTLYQAAILAGMLQRPARNPIADPAGATARADVVLNAMVDAKFISAREAEAARTNPGRIVPPARDPSLRYFGQWVLDQLAAHVSLAAAGERDLIVRTTLDSSLQQFAQERTQRLMQAYAERYQVGQVAVLLMTPGGAVRAMLGGRDYHESQFNRVTQARRQPGSLYKLFVLLAALEAGVSLDDRFVDEPTSVGGWSPRNHDGRYLGAMTLREAIAESRNTIVVQLAENIGRKRVAALAARLGVSGGRVEHPSLALGTSEATLLQLTGAYASIAEGGRRSVPYGILEIRARSGETIYRRAASALGEPLIAARHVHAVNDALAQVIAKGTGRRAAIGRPAAGKTGTTQDGRDAWFIGYTPQLVAGVWLGNDDNRAMNGVGGGSLPAVLWAQIMRDAHADQVALPLFGVPGTAHDTAPEAEFESVRDPADRIR
jgi:penicillin-binding protein 1A